MRWEGEGGWRLGLSCERCPLFAYLMLHFGAVQMGYAIERVASRTRYVYV